MILSITLNKQAVRSYEDWHLYECSSKVPCRYFNVGQSTPWLCSIRCWLNEFWFISLHFSPLGSTRRKRREPLNHPLPSQVFIFSWCNGCLFVTSVLLKMFSPQIWVARKSSIGLISSNDVDDSPWVFLRTCPCVTLLCVFFLVTIEMFLCDYISVSAILKHCASHWLSGWKCLKPTIMGLRMAW